MVRIGQLSKKQIWLTPKFGYITEVNTVLFVLKLKILIWDLLQPIITFVESEANIHKHSILVNKRIIVSYRTTVI